MKKDIDEKVKEAKRLIELNEDSRHYFYVKADEAWLDWLWKNGFFDVLKGKAKRSEEFSYRTPELRYLIRMAEFDPALVTDIMLDIPISEDNANLKIINQFLHICSQLPGQYLAKIIEKILAENWPLLMRNNYRRPMDYAKMFESLEKSGYHKEIIELATVVLALREDDLKKISAVSYLERTPFYFKDISYTKVFQYLSNIDEMYLEDAINLSLSILKRLTKPFEKDEGAGSPFERNDLFPLYGLDVFTCGIRSKFRESGQEDIQEIVALVKVLLERFLKQQCKKKAKIFYKDYFENLPDSWLIWRIRLFVLTLCPKELMSYVKEAIFRIFKEENYSDLVKGAEYKKALKLIFPLMKENDQSQFVSSAKVLFCDNFGDDEAYLKKWDGIQVFSVIGKNLSEDQISELVEAGFEIDLEYEPTPMLLRGEAGFVSPKGPIGQEEFHTTPVRTIVQNLKNNWSPNALKEQDVERDFLNPLNAEGMGFLIKDDVKTRVHEYLEYVNYFLDTDNIDMHYLYSLLSGLTIAIEKNTEPFENTVWDMLIDFCLQIIISSKEQSQKQQEYEREAHNTWLGRWNAVLSEMIRLLNMVLSNDGKKLGFEWFSYRKEILFVVEFSFSFPDPTPMDEQIISAKITVSSSGKDTHVCDPFSLAINSIRGKGFELFALAVQLDTEKDADLSDDIKRLYEGLLNTEKTRALFFLFGRYLPMFYFRSKFWIKSILNKVFPPEIESKYLYLAAWEGFISNGLYLDMFEDEDIQQLYRNAIVLIDKDYPHQEHFINPEEVVSQHFALAYVISDFEFGNELFEFFWDKGRLEQHIAFVDWLGRSFITTQNPKSINFLKEDENARKKIKDMWGWILDNYNDPSIFDGIGFWINLDKEIFLVSELSHYLAKTLAKTNGFLSWDVGLEENIIELAEGSPEDTIEIIRFYILEGGVRKGLNSLYFIPDDKWMKVFEILYKYPLTKESTYSLINDLIKEGGSSFWKLKEVLDTRDV
jgi:hypothetical protein